MPGLLVLLLLAMAGPARSSTPDAWAEFRTEVADRCIRAARAQGMRSPRPVVHPWGTTSHGIAVLVAGSERRICIMDKRTKVVELTPGG